MISIFPECARRYEMFATRGEAESCARRSTWAALAVAMCVVMVIVILQSPLYTVATFAVVGASIVGIGGMVMGWLAGRQWLASDLLVQDIMRADPTITRAAALAEVVRQDLASEQIAALRYSEAPSVQWGPHGH